MTNKQEPVLVVEKEPDYMSGGHFHAGTKPHIDPIKVWNLPIGTKLYTQREWVGLTPEERKQLWDEWENGHVVEAIEAKLKEKNT